MPVASTFEMARAISFTVFAIICLVGGVGGLAEKRPPHTAPGLRRASKELRGGGDIAVLDHDPGVGASVPREMSGELATEKLWKQLLQSKDETIRKLEEASKALLREKEEASKKQEEASKKQEEASKALLREKDETLLVKDQLLAERTSEIVELRARMEAVVANRYIVETTATLHERAAQRTVSSHRQGCENFIKEYLVDQTQRKLSNDAKEIYQQLVNRTAERIEERSVCSELNDIYHELSKHIHYPDWLNKDAPRGIYAGSEGGPLGMALGIWIAQAQKLHYIQYPVILVLSRGIEVKIENGTILDRDL